MRRICHILPSLNYSGAASQIKLLAEGLPRDEFETHVIGLKGGPVPFPHAKVTTIGQSWSIDPGAYMRLRAALKKIGPDIVHTWRFTANTYGRAAARCVGVKRIIASERAVDQWKVWHELAIDQYYAKRTERVVVNSEAVRAFYQSKGIPAAKITVIPAGVQVNEAPESSPPEAYPPGAFLIGTAGALTPDRRIKDVIWAGDLLKCIRDDAHLLIFGDGPHRWRLEKYARQTSMADRVRFFGQSDALADWLPHLHVAWLGSGHTGCSSWLLEAMAAGLPVVAADSACNREVVAPDETGYLIPLGDRASLARWTNVLLNDSELRERMGSAGKQRTSELFSAEAMVKRYAEVYRGAE